MEIYLFVLGVFVTGLVIASVFFVNEEEKKNITILTKQMKWIMMEWEIMEDFLKKNNLLSSSFYKTSYKIYHCNQ